MANYYTLLSTKLTLPESTLDILEALLRESRNYPYEHDNPNYREGLDGVVLKFYDHFRTIAEKNQHHSVKTYLDCELAIHCDYKRVSAKELEIIVRESVNLEALARAIHYALKVTDRPEKVLIEYAMTCSRPLYDGFGGGVLCITKDGWTIVSTGDLLNIFDKNDPAWQERFPLGNNLEIN